MNTEEILRKLISYKTVSETSNNYLADFIIKFLKGLGIKAIKIKGQEGRFNVYCKIGPNVDGGIILSGHTDVVPTEGQEWKTVFRQTLPYLWNNTDDPAYVSLEEYDDTSANYSILNQLENYRTEYGNFRFRYFKR